MLNHKIHTQGKAEVVVKTINTGYCENSQLTVYLAAWLEKDGIHCLVSEMDLQGTDPNPDPDDESWERPSLYAHVRAYPSHVIKYRKEGKVTAVCGVQYIPGVDTIFGEWLCLKLCFSR
jgi:hypothetical protein